MVEQSVEFADRLKIVTAIKAAGLIKMRCYRASGLIYMNLNYWIQKIESMNLPQISFEKLHH